MKKRGTKPEAGTPQASQASKVRVLREIHRLAGEALHAIEDDDIPTVRAKLETIRRRARNYSGGAKEA